MNCAAPITGKKYMKKTIRPRRELLLAVLALLLVFLIVCPVVSILPRRSSMMAAFDLYRTWQTLSQSENAQMIANSLLLGVLVVLLSTVIAAPLAYLFSRTKFAKYRVF